ncbi:MAG TPA: hypothetical protein VFL76_02955 [Edaphocola sp.]|nr:hypothetical protein [Edaphocola sp.]
MQAAKLKTQKKKLIESLGVYFEQEKLVAPLAARILATLIINGSQGTTFEQLVTDLEASKSTVCTHLNALEAQQRIGYFTKCGDRKRYYTMAPGYVSRKINTTLRLWYKERELQKQLLFYKQDYNKGNPESPLTTSIHENAIDFFNQSIHFFEELAIKYQTKEQPHNTEIL